MSVLIIDDSLTVRMDLDEGFREAGYRTVLCESAGAARKALADTIPSLIVLDVLLPDGNGISLLRELRTHQVMQDVPVVLLSSVDEVKDRLEGLAHGAHEFLGKPYDRDSVVRRAAKLMQTPAQSREEAAPLVLVIDDSLTYRNLLGEQLRASGYRTALSDSAGTGLRLARELKPQAIIVDGIMPQMDGPAFIQKLRLDPGLSRIPCLLLTAADEVESEIAALEQGADAYARKKDGSEVLIARLRAMLRSAGGNDPEQASVLLSPKRVLAVDDSLTYLEVLTAELRREGYEVVRAQSGAEALALLEVEHVDCVILDLLMPGMTGTETCQSLKSNRALRNVPVIILTASEGRDALLDGINSGADDYVGKSSSFDVIKARLRAQLRRKQIEDESRAIRDRLQKQETEARVAREVADARKDLLDELSKKNEKLAFHVEELNRLNGELQTFAYSASHDLRQPLRGISGFSKILHDRYGSELDEQGRHYLDRIVSATDRMGRLIDGLLVLSRVSQGPLERRSVALGKMARKILRNLSDTQPGRAFEFVIDDELEVQGDLNLLESAMENLLGNAWKFTRERDLAHIAFGASTGDRVYFVRDNGAGFNMEYADRLFGPFQRLHSDERFEGTGVGLATVQRIIHRHGGRIWAESIPEVGTTFFFTLAEGARDAAK